MNAGKDIITFKKLTIVLGLCWITILGISLAWNLLNISIVIQDLAKAEAESNYNKDIVYRHWAASHGGVYVPITKTTIPNTYLSHIPDRDIETIDGKKLTLINPALMTREALELGEKEYGLKGHITSLNVLNPINKPYEWERNALKAFDAGAQSYTIVEKEGGETYLRHMKPMITISSCLKCHGKQGYKIGEVRGGISISIPMSKYHRLYSTSVSSIYIVHILVFIMGLAFGIFMSKQLLNQMRAKNDAFNAKILSEQELQEQNNNYKALNEKYNSINEQLKRKNDDLETLNKELALSKQSTEISERKFKSLLENSPVAIILSDKEGVIKYASPMCKRVLGYTDSQLTGGKLIDLVFIEDLDKFKKNWIDMVLTYTEIRDFEYRIVDENENNIWISHYANCVDYRNNELMIQSTIINISHTKAIEYELVKAKLFAENNDKHKSAFLANMSHEIRTPINGIIGFSQRLSKPNISDEKKDEYIKIINNCSTQLLTLIDDLIDIAKIEANQLVITNQQSNVNDILDELYSIFNEKVKNTNIKLTVEKGCKDKELTIETDPIRLRQIITNLLNNAIKFTQAGTISFGYTLKNNNIEFFVTDSGIGIEEDKQDLIFDRFRQADSSISQSYGGSGLGLSISKALVELLGGKIWLHSVVNQGTTFWFTIPLPAQTLSSPPSPIAHFQPENFEKKKVIVAEDEETNFFLLNEMLDEMGFEVIRARDGSQAVLVFSRFPETSLLIMDIKMPVMNGFDAIKQIRIFNPDVPIIVQSAYVNLYGRDFILESGIDEVINKPIHFETLKEAINTVFRKLKENE